MPRPASEPDEPAPGPGSGAAHRFPCPKCGADLLYDPAAKGLRCPFCGEKKEVEAGRPGAERDLDDALRAAAKRHDDRSEAVADALAARSVLCEACGATVVVPPNEAAGRCAYCGSTRVLPATPDPSRIPPECLLPFAVDRVQAEELFRKWIRSLWFRPNALKRGNALAEMKGVLVPYWTFDAHAESSWSAMAGYHYTVTVGSGKNAHTETRTRWVPAAGRRSDDYDDLLVCASRGLEPGLLAAVEPFRTGDLVRFREEYLAGWSAEAYAVDVREAWGVGDGRIRQSQVGRCAGDVPGDTHMSLSVSTTLSGKRYRHVLLPIWVCAYRFRGKPWRFLVNGQTGEVQGKAPWSWVKITLLVVGVLAVGAIIAFAASR